MTTGTTMPTLAQEREQIRDQRSEYGDAWAASAYADVAERAITRLAVAEQELNHLRRENDWAAQFDCPTCGPCSMRMVTTKKTCALCGAMLNRNMHPRLAAAERVIQAVRRWEPS